MKALHCCVRKDQFRCILDNTVRRLVSVLPTAECFSAAYTYSSDVFWIN